MKNLFMVFTALVSLTHKLLGRGGMKALIAENLLLKQQLFLITRSRQRAPNFSPLDRFLLGLWTIFLDPRRIKRAVILVQPSTLLKISSGVDQIEISPAVFLTADEGSPVLRDLPVTLLELVLGLKRQESSDLGVPKISEQISQTFAIPVNKDVVRQDPRLPTINRTRTGCRTLVAGFSLAIRKDSLWRIDVFPV